MKFFLPLLSLLLLASCSGPKGPTIAERKAEQLQKYESQLRDEQRTLAATDSLLPLLVEQINTATAKGFEYEKTEYDDLGRFRPQGMDPGENVQRTYLRCAVDDYGRTQLIANYCGSKSFVVEKIRITASDGSSVTSMPITPNDGSNYSYDIDGVHYQTVTFLYAGRITEGMTQDSTRIASADTDGGCLAFIAQNRDDQGLRCAFVDANDKALNVSLSAKEREAMAATYELGVLLRESVRLQQENKTASLKVKYLEEVLLKKQLEQQNKSK